MEFKDKFNQLLIERNIRKIDVARVTGATKGSITQWSSGDTRPGNKYLPALVNLLQCDMTWLMDDSKSWEDQRPNQAKDAWQTIKAQIDALPRKEALKVLARIDQYIDDLLEQK